MKTKNKPSPFVFVVVREGRRVEHTNYDNRKDAWKRANRLKNTLTRLNDPFAHKIWVKHTNKPKRIR